MRFMSRWRKTALGASATHNSHDGKWGHVGGQTTNLLSIDQYNEIILNEDDELMGLRFRQPEGAPSGFEVAPAHDHWIELANIRGIQVQHSIPDSVEQKDWTHA